MVLHGNLEICGTSCRPTGAMSFDLRIDKNFLCHPSTGSRYVFRVSGSLYVQLSENVDNSDVLHGGLSQASGSINIPYILRTNRSYTKSYVLHFVS